MPLSDAMRAERRVPATPVRSNTFRSPQMRELLSTLARVAVTDLPVVIAGEPGTGKEWAARELHRLSPRVEGRFLTVACGTASSASVERRLFGFESISYAGVEIEPGAIEEAAEGTLHLDDAGALPDALVQQIVRVAEYGRVRRIGGLTDRAVDARLVWTVAIVPGDAGPDIRLRSEPWTRLSPLLLHIPPLRERREDLPVYIAAFLEELQLRHRLGERRVSPEAFSLIAAHPWPGNVRALRSAIEFAAVISRGEEILPEDLPAYLRP